MHALRDLNVVEERVGPHEVLGEVIRSQHYLLNLLLISFLVQLSDLLMLFSASEDLVDLIHRQVLHEQLIIFLHLERIAKTDV